MTDFPNNPALNDTFTAMGRTWQWNGTAWRAVSAFQNTDWDDVLNKPETFPPATHSHGISEVTGLQTALDGKQASGSYATAAQGALADTALQPAALTPYRTSAAQDVLDAGKQPAGSYAPASGISPTAITGTAVITTDPRLSDARTPTTHSHAVADVTGLQTALDEKSATSHTHSSDVITEGTTNLFFTAARAVAAQAWVVTQGYATTTALNSAISALVTGVSSVAGKTGAVTLAKADVGLGNVDNTSDTAKPISTATQTALNGKQAAGSYAPASGIAPTAITGTAVINSDSRLSDSRTPTSHKSSHATGGADALTPADIGAEPAITMLPISQGGTGATTAEQARVNLGILSIQPNPKSTSYTLQLTDAGKYINISTGGVTVPSAVFASGDVISVYNNSSANQTITQGSGVTMYLAGTATTGNRTLSQRGVATILCVGSNTFAVIGGGLS